MVILVTHNDLDGLGCEVVAKVAFEQIKVLPTGFDNVSATIEDAIDMDPDVLIISDVWPDNVELIWDKLVEFPGRLYIFDHHKSAIESQAKLGELRKVEGKVGFEYSATGYIARYFNIWLSCIQYIDDYDLSGTSEGLPGTLNRLFWELPREKMRSILFRTPLVLKPDEIKLDEELLRRSYDNFLEASETLKTTNAAGYKIAYIEASKDKAYIYNELQSEYDYVILLDSGRGHIGFRGLDRCDVLAECFGGGGHPRAAGAPKLAEYGYIMEKVKEVLAKE